MQHFKDTDDVKPFDNMAKFNMLHSMIIDLGEKKILNRAFEDLLIDEGFTGPISFGINKALGKYDNQISRSDYY